MLPAFFICQYEDKKGKAKKKPATPQNTTGKGIILSLTLKGRLE